MPIASGILNSMKPGEGNDSLDTFIRHTMSKEPVLPSARTGDAPVQWFQFLHAFDQPDLPGWPLLTPARVQTQKCEKCSREFYSIINYRRHIRVHRRPLNVNKESQKSRDLLAAFWDKLSLEEAKEAVSFDDVMLKDVPGLSVIRALESSIRTHGAWSLPQVYVKAGASLLDIIQAKPSRLPVSSPELFSILDDASEGTFLCAGTADSLQKYVFDGEAAKNSLELRNLVASTSFLFEKQLVKAWIANKDAEALRCQKQLVEEEEAAQKRQAELLERKRQKKLRQKEQKVKEQYYGCTRDLSVSVDAADELVSAEVSGPSSSAADEPISAYASGHSSLFDSGSNSPDAPPYLDASLESMQFQIIELNKDIQAHIDFNRKINQGETQTLEPQIVTEIGHEFGSGHMNPQEYQTIEPGENGHQHIVTSPWQVAKSQRGRRSHLVQTFQSCKPGPIQLTSPSKDRTLVNGSKVWTKKHKMSDGGEVSKHSLLEDVSNRIEENNCEVLIGSISITVKSFTHHQDVRGSPSAERRNDDSEGVVVLEKVHNRIMPSKICMPSVSSDNDDQKENSREGSLPFSVAAAKEFLAQRWKEAISEDHVELVLSSRPEVLHGCSDVHHGNATVCNLSNPQESSDVGNAGNRLGVDGAQVKVTKNPDTSLKVKYIPKPKGVALA